MNSISEETASVSTGDPNVSEPCLRLRPAAAHVEDERVHHAFSGAFVKLEVANDQGINTLYYRYLTHSLKMITEEVIKVKTRGRRHQRDVSLFLVAVPACAAWLRTADYHASAEDWMCQVERSSSA